ncbi:hypothetical protein AGABI2DRAFT_122173 [Agaricus bisporus var. bisporus H97]|uniref:hypothetical protein n=1 Tax=Agaricus bisporus var. bisporus (strain H97 / ATCC MYA-4626 / FGSC 10389) TaxID=936046 RepID=UPI00029F674B|nr:hypothetical protein AGABI2DRAFT_122173 [Agaricus bisporus var. bisporus H97]EKV43269.1 hypothetical protein AGABI2DRAFT_122173 [Agaricus bisporus var. bisporus H97]
MAYYHLNKNYLSGVILLVILCHLSGALAALYPTQPVAKTVFATGSSALVTWKDDTHVPHVYDLGDLVIKLYTAQAVSPPGACRVRSLTDYVTICAGIRSDLGSGRKSELVWNSGDVSGRFTERYSLVSYLAWDAVRQSENLSSFLTFRGPGLQRDIYTANFAIVSDPTLVKASSTTLSAVPPVQSLLADGSMNSTAANMNLTSPGQQMFTSTTMLPVSTVAADQYGSPYRNNGDAIGRQDDGQLRLDHARIFFEAARYPDDFHRAARPMSADNEAVVLAIHPLEPGANIAGVNTYTVDRNAPRLDNKCGIFEYHINHTLHMLYPNTTGNLLDAIRANIHYFYASVQARGCSEIFPYSRFEDGESNTYYAFPDYPEVELPEYGTFPYPPVEALTYTDAPAPASTSAVPPAASMTVPVTLSD